MEKMTSDNFKKIFLAKKQFTDKKNDFYWAFLDLLGDDELQCLNFSGLHSIDNIYHIIITDEAYEGERFFDLSDAPKDKLEILKEKEATYKETLLNKFKFDDFIKSIVPDKYNDYFLKECSVSNVLFNEDNNEIKFTLKSNFIVRTEEGQKVKSTRFKKEYNLSLEDYLEKIDLKI